MTVSNDSTITESGDGLQLQRSHDLTGLSSHFNSCGAPKLIHEEDGKSTIAQVVPKFVSVDDGHPNNPATPNCLVENVSLAESNPFSSFQILRFSVDKATSPLSPLPPSPASDTTTSPRTSPFGPGGSAAEISTFRCSNNSTTSVFTQKPTSPAWNGVTATSELASDESWSNLCELPAEWHYNYVSDVPGMLTVANGGEDSMELNTEWQSFQVDDGCDECFMDADWRTFPQCEAGATATERATKSSISECLSDTSGDEYLCSDDPLLPGPTEMPMQGYE